MTFREQLTVDNGAVFLPTTTGRDAEFDDVLEIGWKDHDPEPVSCILDESEGQNPSDGVTQWDATLYVRASDITTPVVNQRLTIDGKHFRVVKAADDYGLLVVNLIRWDS